MSKNNTPIISENEEIKYVIYCRKSTDESSNKQVASIARQIQECLRFAEKEKLEIASKPKDFSAFESDKDLFKENQSKDKSDAILYKKTRHLYIVKEQHSAKKPFDRKKWKKITKLIQDGKIRGILSYSPDRQARNMVEGGQIIDFVDQEILDLKYANFHFEPNASGKMMLGIWFVFSKQYSDKLSEDITSANNKKYKEGETLGNSKRGYIRGGDNKWKPNPRNFSLIRKAFDLKIKKKWSDSKISSHLNKAGFEYQLGDKARYMTHQKLSKMWTDPFYYGVWIQAKKLPVDLREIDSEFEPMISKNEHDLLCELSRKPLSERRKRGLKKDDVLHSLRVIDGGLMTDTQGNTFGTSLPNRRQRHLPKLETLKQTNPSATYADIIQPHQIKIVNSKTNKTIAFDVIDRKIKEKFKDFKITEKQYLEYLGYAKKQLSEILDRNDILRQTEQLQINRLSRNKSDFIENNLNPAARDPEEEALYQNKKKSFEEKIEFHKEQIKKINNKENIEILNTEMILKMFHNADKYYEKASYVQKAKFINIFLLNITYHHEKWLEIKVKPDLEELFFSNGGDGEN